MARIGVVTLGGPGWPRYALHDEEYRNWTGTGWSADVKGAALFASEQTAAVEYERVVGLVRAGQTTKKYTARVTVRVVGDQQYDPDRLKRYLSAGCRLHLDPDTLDGPAPDSAVTVEIEWDRLEPGAERSDEVE
jgi:hypothetical protein